MQSTSPVHRSFGKHGGVIQQLLDGLAGWALWGSLAALLLSAIVWALGSEVQRKPTAGIT